MIKTVKICLKFFSAMLLFLSSVMAEQHRPPRSRSVRQSAAQKLGELPPLTSRIQKQGTVTDPLEVMGVTTAFGSQDLHKDSGDLKIYPNIDLVQFEVAAIKEFLQGKGNFADDNGAIANKGVIVLRYGVEDDRALKMFKQIRKSGMHSAVLVTDGPITMNAKGPHYDIVTNRDGQQVEADFTNDIRPEFLSDRANGPDIKSMLEANYKLYSPVLPKTGDLIEAGDFYVSMSAIANSALDRKPIMHEKEVILYVLKDAKGSVTPENIQKLYVMHGTGNWTRIHVNRNFIYSDQSKKMDGPGFFSLRHALSTLETFARAGKTAKIVDIPNPVRERITDAKGNFWEMAYTDGKYELNQNMVDSLNTMSGDEETLQRLSGGKIDEYKRLKGISENVEVKEIVLSHFVMTNAKVIEAIFNLWQKQYNKGKPFRVRGALDERAVGLRSFGLGALMAGYDTKTEFGRTRRSLGQEFSKYVDVMVQMAESPGQDGKPPVNIDPDGPPSDRILWHDKTTQIQYRIGQNSQWRSDIWTGSYNNSNNFHNLERQDWFSIPANASLAKAISDSIDDAINDEVKKTRAGKKMILPIEKAVFVKELATFLGQSPIDLDWNVVLNLKTKLENLHLKSDQERADILKELGLRIYQMGQRPSRLVSRLHVQPEDLSLRIQSMAQFFKWYTSEPLYRQGHEPGISANEILSVGLSILEKPMSAKMALLDILWRPFVPQHILEARAYRIYQHMGLEKIFLRMLAKAETDGKNSEKPFESEKFPFAEDNIFTLNLMDAVTTKEFSELVEKSEIGKAVALLSEWVQRNKGKLGAKADQMATPAELDLRLRGLVRFFEWYKTLPTEKSGKQNVARLEATYITSQFLSENLDLVLLKTQPEQKLKETLTYLISMKGYRDGGSGTPGNLTVKTSEALEIFRKTPDQSLSAKGILDLRGKDKMTASGALKCQGIFVSR